MTDLIDVSRLAAAYRRLVLWFGAQLALNFGTVALNFLENEAAAQLLQVGIAVLLIVTVLALAYYGSKTATSLGSSVGWLWGIAMLVPCANVITLLTLSYRATRACRANGVPVGFFGPLV